jgi:hypothetical protein
MTTSILYFTYADDRDGCWKQVDAQAARELVFTNDAESNHRQLRAWLIKKHNARLSGNKDYNVYHIDFDDEADAIIFKLKLGV